MTVERFLDEHAVGEERTGSRPAALIVDTSVAAKSTTPP
jgi:hypothetical protein